MDIKCVYVVVPVYNRRDITEWCLRRLLQQTYSGIVRIIVVDDGSSDGTSEMIVEKFPEVALLRGDGNNYWTGSTHMGVEHALTGAGDQDYILVLNDDLIFDDDFIASMVRLALEHPNALMHPCTVYEHAPDVIHFGGVEVNWWTAKATYINRGKSLDLFGRGHCQPSCLLWGQGLMVPVPVFLEIGNYDRRIVHRGDPEFPRRAAKVGYDLLVTYDVVVQMYRDDGNTINKQKTYALRDFNSYFFNILSSGQLKLLFWNSMLMRKNFLQGFSFYLFSVTRHMWNFFRHVRHI